MGEYSCKAVRIRNLDTPAALPPEKVVIASPSDLVRTLWT
jgi:hypothetical protein